MTPDEALVHIEAKINEIVEDTLIHLTDQLLQKGITDSTLEAVIKSERAKLALWKQKELALERVWLEGLRDD